MIFSVTDSNCLAQYNCKLWYSVTNIKYQPDVICHFLYKFFLGGVHRFTMLYLLSLTK
jgi:hypothetical protein